MFIRSGLSLPAVCMLTFGCGGGTAVSDGGTVGVTDADPPEVSVDAVLIRTGFPDATLQRVPTYLAETDQFLFPDDFEGAQGTKFMSRRPDAKLANTPFLAAYGATGASTDKFTGVRGALPSGTGTAYALRRVETGPPARFERGHERLGETVLPTSGRADFAGGYMAVLGDATTADYRGFVTGTATLTADFDRMAISGTISNRINDSDRKFDPLRLTESPIETRDGSFGGPTADGRQIDLPDFDGATGRYSGLIVGARGEAAVGSVEITHQRLGVDTIREWGAFVAE
jgi:hypothetical protein